MRRRPIKPAVLTAVLTRAGHACEVCRTDLVGDRGEGWSIHHRRPHGMGSTNWVGIDRPPNLLAVCGSGTTGCHGAIESNRTAAYEAGWLVSQYHDPATTAVLIGDGRVVYLTADATYEEVR